MEYLEERFPEPALLPAAAAERARARLAVFCFDDLLGDDYYAYRRGEQHELERRLAALPVGESLFVDLAYLPWVMRLRELYGAALPARIAAWLDQLAARPAVAAELELVAGLA
jgi:glutathione S-transferase